MKTNINAGVNQMKNHKREIFLLFFVLFFLDFPAYCAGGLFNAFNQSPQMKQVLDVTLKALEAAKDVGIATAKAIDETRKQITDALVNSINEMIEGQKREMDALKAEIATLESKYELHKTKKVEILKNKLEKDTLSEEEDKSIDREEPCKRLLTNIQELKAKLAKIELAHAESQKQLQEAKQKVAMAVEKVSTEAALTYVKTMGKAHVAQKQEAVRQQGEMERLKYLTSVLQDPKAMGKTAAGLGLVTLAIAVAAYGTFLVGKKIEQKWLTPKVFHTVSVGMFGIRNSKPPSRMHLFVAPPETKENVKRLFNILGKVVREGGNLPNIIFYGPPGTGKTFLATELALHLGFEYAITSGADLGQLDEMKQREQLAHIFSWSDTLKDSGTKLVIVFEEIDGVAPERRRTDITQGQKASLNLMLDRIKEKRNPAFMVIGTTNLLELVDGAFLARCMLIPVLAPGEAEREQLLMNYIGELVKDGIIRISQTNAQEFAKKYSKDEWTAGFTGRDIQDIALTLADITPKGNAVNIKQADIELAKKIEADKTRFKIEKQKQQHGMSSYYGVEPKQPSQPTAAPLQPSQGG